MMANLVAYSLQFAALAIAASIITRLVRLRTPLPSLRFWQTIFAVSLVLPLLQPSAIATASESATVFTSFVTPQSITALASIGAAAPWVLYLVIAGVAIRLAWLAFGLVRLQRMADRAEPTTAFDPLLEELSISITTTAAIAVTNDLETPATVGVRRPLILVPPRLLSLPQPVQRAVLTHELIHVRRRDWLHTIAEELWCAVLWFHPAARLISSRLSLARETVVDEATILLTRDRRAYAEALLAFAGPQRREPHVPGVIALIGRRQLSQRISLIAEEDPMPRRRLAVCFLISLFAAGAATSAAVTTFPMRTASAQAPIFVPGDGVTLPTVVHEVKPDYTPEALQKKIEGSVWMSIVVGTSGDVTDVDVTTSLDTEYGLDAQAVAAARLWKFRPGMKDGAPVAVRVTLEMRFTLK